MDDTFYLEQALQNLIGCNEYTWKTHEDDGTKIPNENRMQYKYIVLTNESLSMPSEADVNAKMAELKKEHEDKIADHIATKTSGKQKLKDLGLDDDEINALLGV
tara:strand:- start:37 stop:348 length:312 start_codon:yes stop_codon:yes gene_type:complete